MPIAYLMICNCSCFRGVEKSQIDRHTNEQKEQERDGGDRAFERIFARINVPFFPSSVSES